MFLLKLQFNLTVVEGGTWTSIDIPLFLYVRNFLFIPKHDGWLTNVHS